MPTLAPTIVIEEWFDPVVAAHGLPAGCRYVRWTWSSILGPTATVLLMTFADVLESDDLVELHTDALARSLGVKKDVLARALARLARFGFVFARGTTLCVRTCVAPVPASKLDRLSAYGRVLHDQLMAERRPEVA